MESTFAEKIDLSGLTACHVCDLLVEKQHILPGSKTVCPRCGTTIDDPKADTVNKTLAVVITGLILWWPANFMPILTMTIIGNTSDNTLMGGVIDLYRGGFYWVSLVVFVCSVLAPSAKFFLLLIVLLHIKLDHYSRLLTTLFRFYGYLDSWGILEVYMISVLVSITKLVDLASIHPGLGLYCFVGLLLTSILAASNLDKERIWESIEQLCQQKNG
jgi:paraquat-inducible protein A